MPLKTVDVLSPPTVSVKPPDPVSTSTVPLPANEPIVRSDNDSSMAPVPTVTALLFPNVPPLYTTNFPLLILVLPV